MLGIRSRVFGVVVSAAVAGLATSSKAATTLYGLSSDTPGTLFTLTPTTGAATNAVTLTGASSTLNVGLASLNGSLYASDVFANFNGVTQATFGTINPTTGAYNPISNQGGSSFINGLAAVSSLDEFYTVDGANSMLATINATTGALTDIGSTGTGEPFADVALNSTSGVLFGIGAFDNDLYTINTATGAATLVGATGLDAGFAYGLTFDPTNSILYASTGFTGTGDNEALYTINTATGAATLVGANGSAVSSGTGLGIDGIAFVSSSGTVSPIPLPRADLAAMVMAVPALGFWMMRRRKVIG